MELFRIEGGRQLNGSVRVEGSKNATLPILGATLAVHGTVVLNRVPKLVDVQMMVQLLELSGLEFHDSGDGQLTIDASQARNAVAPYELVRKMRAGVCVLGPLLARFGQACVSLPGGCNIGHRPIDLHLKGLAALGAEIRIEGGYVIAECQRLRGADVYLGGPNGSTVTGTCNVLSAAVTARGHTVIHSAAMEPEVCDLGRFLIAAGARIQGLGTSVIEIEGVDALGDVRHTVIADRIEAGTLAIAAAITGGRITLMDAPIDDMTSTLGALCDMGVRCNIQHGQLTIDGGGSTDQQFASRRAVEVVALPYPGLPTDVQAQLMALMTLTPGVSVITDQVFPDRFIHAAELVRMGADIRVSHGTAVIRGVERLSGAAVMASDLRASAALVLAAMAAQGTSEVRRVYHLDRGYVEFEKKLNALGASIARSQIRTKPTAAEVLL